MANAPVPRILVLAAGPLCRNPRVHKEAVTLGRAGFDVTVSSIANIERFEAFDRDMLVGAPFSRIAVDRLSRGPASRIAGFMERAASWLARRAVRWGVDSPLALGPYHALKALAVRHAADLTIVHAELPFCIGAHLIARGLNVAADFEDWHSRDLLPSARSARPLRLLEKTEALLMRRSAYSSAPSESMATALHAAYGGQVPIVIPNTFPLQPEPSLLPRQRPPSFFWYSQTIGEGRGLEAFLSAWSLMAAESRVCLLGEVSEAYRESLVRSVPERRRKSLDFLPLVAPDALPGLIATHDIGLAIEPDTPESRFLTTTNKVFQYLNAGLAIVATPTAGQREVLSKVPGCGILAERSSPEALAAQLDALVSRPGLLAEMGAASRAGAVNYYSWERSEPVLIAAVNRALGKPSAT